MSKTYDEYQKTKSRLYSHNRLIISEYSDGIHTKYKLVYMPTLRNSGVEIDEPDFLPGDVVSPDGDIVEKYENGNVCKLAKNVYRARSVIFELAYCNPWDWFFTGTLDSRKCDRADLDIFRQRFSDFVKNVRRRDSRCSNLKYLIVPELHGDCENWHFHGFLSGLPVECLHKFQIGDKMSGYIASKIRRGQDVYTWRKYEKLFGWCDLEPIGSHDGACKYVTKYISKSLDRSVSEIGKHMFYASIGLQRRSRVFLGDISPVMLDYMNNHPKSFRGDYTVCLWLDSLDDVKIML